MTNRLEGYYLPTENELYYYDSLYDLFYSLPNDGRNYYWSINYQQLYEISNLKNANGDCPLKYDMYDYTRCYSLFGIPVVIDNLNEPVSLQPVNE